MWRCWRRSTGNALAFSSISPPTTRSCFPTARPLRPKRVGAACALTRQSGAHTPLAAALSPQRARTSLAVPCMCNSSTSLSAVHVSRAGLTFFACTACDVLPPLRVSGQCANLLARGKRLPNTMRVAPFKFRPCTRFPSDLAVQAQGT